MDPCAWPNQPMAKRKFIRSKNLRDSSWRPAELHVDTLITRTWRQLQNHVQITVNNYRRIEYRVWNLQWIFTEDMIYVDGGHTITFREVLEWRRLGLSRRYRTFRRWWSLLGDNFWRGFCWCGLFRRHNSSDSVTAQRTVYVHNKQKLLPWKPTHVTRVHVKTYCQK